MNTPTLPLVFDHQPQKPGFLMSLGTCTAQLKTIDEQEERIAYLEELNRALVESLERVEALFDFVGRNDVTTETDRILDSLFSEARNLLQVQGLALAMVDPSDYQFRISRVVPRNRTSWVKQEMRAQIDCGIFPWVLKTRRPSVVPNLSDPENLKPILVPLATARRILGMMILWSDVEETEVTPQLLKMLSITSRQAALALENAQLYQRVEKERESLQETGKNLMARQKRIDRELNIARIIQSNLLPSRFPTKDFCQFAARYVPTYEVGGDFYDVMSLEDGSIGIVIADVSGHGVPAAFGTAVLKVLLGGWVRRPKDLAETVNQLNRELKSIFEKHQYLTLFLGRIYPESLKLEYVLAGHPPPILVQAGSSRLRALSTTGFLVGFDTDTTFRKRSVNLHPGDRLLCYTDGLIEIRNPEQKAYRLSRLRESLRKHHKEPLKKLPNLLIKDAKNFRCRDSMDDDLSILVMEISSSEHRSNGKKKKNNHSLK